MSEKLRQSHDLLRIVPAFRHAGAAAAPVHTLLPRLQTASAANGLDYFLELNPVPQSGDPLPDGTVGTLILAGGEHFGLQVPFHATNTVFGEVSLEHNSESAPLWPYASVEQIQCELNGFLQRHDIEAFCVRLGALRAAQELLSNMSFDEKNQAMEDWRTARSSLENVLSADVSSCCEGLRGELFAVSNMPPDFAPLSRHCVLLRMSAAGFELVLEPPITMESNAARELGIGQYASKSASSDETGVFLALFSRQLGLADDPGACSTAMAVPLPGRTEVAQSPTGPAVGRPAPSEHQQCWTLHDGPADAVLVRQLLLHRSADLPRILARLRRHAAFASTLASALRGPLLVPTADAVARMAAGSPEESGALWYRVEVQMQPPECLSLIVLLPEGVGSKGEDARPVCAETKLYLAPADEGNERRALAWLATTGSCLYGGSPVWPAHYLARLLDASCSLPLAVAYSVRAMQTL